MVSNFDGASLSDLAAPNGGVRLSGSSRLRISSSTLVVSVRTSKFCIPSQNLIKSQLTELMSMLSDDRPIHVRL